MFRSLTALAALALSVGFLPAQTPDRPLAEEPLPEGKKSLILMDLLQRPQAEMAPPQRNIFAPGARQSRPADTVIPPGEQWTAEDDDAETTGIGEERLPAPPLMTVNLRYIGFIESSRRMIALLVIEGQAVAVFEGEVVGEGIRIGRVTREQVEIVLPDGSTKLFSLEGE
jgi:hypothetical protein